MITQLQDTGLPLGNFLRGCQGSIVSEDRRYADVYIVHIETVHRAGLLSVSRSSSFSPLPPPSLFLSVSSELSLPKRKYTECSWKGHLTNVRVSGGGR